MRPAQAAARAAEGSPHAFAVAELVADRVARNKLLFCAREIRKAIELVGSKGWVRVKEEEGLVRVRVEHGKYYLVVRAASHHGKGWNPAPRDRQSRATPQFALAVPDLYPAEAPSLTFGKTSFPGANRPRVARAAPHPPAAADKLTRVFHGHAEGIISQCAGVRGAGSVQRCP